MPAAPAAANEEPVARVFVSQERLDAWNLAEMVSLDADVLSFVGEGEQCRLRLAPAVLFTRPLSGADARGLVGRVRTESELAAAGADTFPERVRLGGCTYAVRMGYVGSLLHPSPQAGTALAAAVARLG